MVTANIVGTARKNENSAAAFLVKPWVIPPMMDAAERLVPGNIAIHCQKPIITAILVEICFSSSILGDLNHESENNKTTPPTIKTIEMTISLPKIFSISSSSNLPKNNAGTTADANFK